jgi:hypothetical protein
MHDEDRDPELQALKSYFTPPGPSESLDSSVLRAYRRGIRFRQRIGRFWMPMIAAIVLAAAAGWIAGVQRKSLSTAAGAAFVPVRQPRIIVVSQGERP